MGNWEMWKRGNEEMNWKWSSKLLYYWYAVASSPGPSLSVYYSLLRDILTSSSNERLAQENDSMWTDLRGLPY